MHLTHVHIENFRGISRLELALDRLTVIIGENNHGKSSLFDVLDRCLGGPGGGETGVWEYRDFRRTATGEAHRIRVVLTFEVARGARGESLSQKLFARAMPGDADGTARLRAEFTGSPSVGVMDARFLDEEGRPLALESAGAVLQRLRQLHPVFLIRLAQPLERDSLAWESSVDRHAENREDDSDPEEAITGVYRRLALARGPVPTEVLRRGLLAAHQLRDQVEDRSRSSLAPVREVLRHFLRDADGDEGVRLVGGGSHNLGLLMVLGALLEMRSHVRLDLEANPIIAIEEPEIHLHPMVLSSTWDVIESLQAQTLVTTNSGEFLSDVPLRLLRRLVRRDGRIEAFQLREGSLDAESLRRVGYHVRAKRGSTLFARCWLLVEGETEYWLLRELARTLGYDLEAEGVRCVEFAQCGVAPLVRLADDLGIAWHLLADGDDSGASFAQDAVHLLAGRRKRDHVTILDRRNIEALLWHHGFEDVYREAARVPAPGPGTEEERKDSPRRIIDRAIRRHSKPYLALTVAEASARRGPDSVPELLRHVIESAVTLAREAIVDGG